MPMGDKQWQADLDRADRLAALNAAAKERSSASHAASVDRVNRETDQQNKLREQAAQTRQDHLEREKRAKEQAEPEHLQTRPVALPVPEPKKGGFLKFLVLAGVVAFFYHIATKNDTTPITASVAPTQSNTPKSVSKAQTTTVPDASSAQTTTVPDASSAQTASVSSAATPTVDEPLTELQTNDTAAEELPFFMTRPVVASDLEGLSAQEIRDMKYELMARHGMNGFNWARQREYESETWYHRSTRSNAEILSSLSELEKQNIQFLDRAAYALP